MANGIEDLMNIRTTGGTQNVPPRPPMQGGLASMGAGQPTMPPVIEEQRAMPPMGGQEMPSEQPQEQGMSIEQDAAMLAEATIGRTGGDPQAAVAILDTAKAMLMQGGQEEPMMMAGGGRLNPGLQALQKTNPEVVDKILKREMGGPLYAEDGMPLTDRTLSEKDLQNYMNMNSETDRTLSEKDLQNYMNMNSETDYETMKQMIMNSLQDFAVGSNPILGPLNKLTQKQQRLQEAYDAAAANSQTGRAISDKEMMSDMSYQDALDMLVKRRRSSTN